MDLLDIDMFWERERVSFPRIQNSRMETIPVTAVMVSFWEHG